MAATTLTAGSVRDLPIRSSGRLTLTPGSGGTITILSRDSSDDTAVPRSISSAETLSLVADSTLSFQAVTADQANVYFKSMLLYSVQNADEETIKKVAFKFIADKDLMQALIRTIEGNIRSFVATKKQAEVLGLRREIVQYVKVEVDHSLEEWGYHLQDLQINDITFDKMILDSMSKVVASNNLKAAAENEGQALLITKTKSAEAEGNAIKISAEAEKEAARLRGQGVALFRQEVAKGMTEAAEQMKQANLDTNVILFSMWTEAIKNFAEYGKGNVIFLDGSPDGMEGTMKQIQALMVKQAGVGK